MNLSIRAEHYMYNNIGTRTLDVIHPVGCLVQAIHDTFLLPNLVTP